MSKKGKRRRYTAEERAAAVKRAGEVGVYAAARELEIPTTTIGNWRHRKNKPPGADGTVPGASPGDSNKGAAVDVSAEPRQHGAKTKKRAVARRYTPSQRAEILEYAAEHGPAAAKKEFGASRFSIREWQRKVRAAARGQGESPTTGPDPKMVEEQRDREILDEWKRHPGLGPSQIRNQLRRKGVKVSVHTARRVMEDAGYRPPKVKREPHDKRYEAVRPNGLWHLDYLHRYVNRAPTFTLILLDDCSRFVVGHGVDDAERADLVIETFEQAVERHGKPEIVLHDKGSAFWSWRGISRFTRLLDLSLG